MSRNRSWTTVFRLNGGLEGRKSKRRVAVVLVVVVAVDAAAVFGFAFLSVDGEFGGGILLVPGDEARRRDEHAARSACARPPCPENATGFHRVHASMDAHWVADLQVFEDATLWGRVIMIG
jgi:hypothetical protein